MSKKETVFSSKAPQAMDNFVNIDAIDINPEGNIIKNKAIAGRGISFTEEVESIDEIDIKTAENSPKDMTEDKSAEEQRQITKCRRNNKKSTQKRKAGCFLGLCSWIRKKRDVIRRATVKYGARKGLFRKSRKEAGEVLSQEAVMTMAGRM